MRKWTAEKGMSLVEATIILMVLAVLTAVAAPSINDYVQDARDVKVKEDVEAIGVSIVRMLRDTGLPCLTKVAATGCTSANRVDVLVSDGVEPLSVTGATTALTAGSAQDESINWNGHADEITVVNAANLDTMQNQLVLNAPNYNDPVENGVAFKGGPRSGIGWRGAYLADPIGPDPWGHAYQSNPIFFGIATTFVGAGAGAEGLAQSGWVKDAIVVSPGRNGILETPFGGSANGGTGAAASDDVFYVMSGSSR